MFGYLHLLRFAARAAKHGGSALASRLPLGDLLYGLAAAIDEEYRKDHGEPRLRAELEALAGAPADRIRQAAVEVVSQEASGLPPEVREALTAYLCGIPAAVRRSLRRPSDPSGTTVPAWLGLRRPEDLVGFLPASLPVFKPGDQPLAEWELVELLGKSAFGEVWKAKNPFVLGVAPVVLKFCLDPVARDLLVRQATVLNQVIQEGLHPGIVRLRQTYLSADPPCLAYDYVEGGDLSGLIQEMNQDGKLTLDFAAWAVGQLASIVAFAHRLDPPLVHRDLKLSNVLVRRGKDNHLSLHVANFGTGGLGSWPSLPDQAGRLSGRSHNGLANRPLSPPVHASPQQIEGQPPDPRDDVHALGVIWYQLVTGHLGLLAVPPDWRDVAEERGMDEEQARLLASCLASRAERRLASASELADRLASLARPQAAGQLAAGPAGINAPHVAPREAVSAGVLTVPAEVLAGPASDTVFPLGVRTEPVLRRTAQKPERRPGEIVAVSLGKGIEMEFAWVPPGSFLMGSPPDEALRNDDEPQHRVTLTRGFFCGVCPVTQGQWQAVLGKNPSRFKDPERPVETVSWVDCADFCKRLGQKTGKRFRLPTEAEWEYACRAGTTTAYYSGNDLEALRKVGWCSYDGDKGSAKETKPVRLFQSNAWGLFDMHGNVWEWCSDWYGDYSGDEADPVGSYSGSTRVLRGGSWFYGPGFARSSRRVRITPAYRYVDFGCRVVLQM